MAVIDRFADAWFGSGGGAVLSGIHQGDRWAIDAVPEHFDVRILDKSEGTTGGLAGIVHEGLIVASGWRPGMAGTGLPGVLWFNRRRSWTRREEARRSGLYPLGKVAHHRRFPLD